MKTEKKVVHHAFRHNSNLKARVDRIELVEWYGEPGAPFSHYLVFIAACKLNSEEEDNIEKVRDHIEKSTKGQVFKSHLKGHHGKPPCPGYRRALEFTPSIDNPVDEARVLLKKIAGIID